VRTARKAAVGPASRAANAARQVDVGFGVAACVAAELAPAVAVAEDEELPKTDWP
jgi:hypothetical protein